MTKQEYEVYLGSAHWRDVRYRYTQSRLSQVCEVCRSNERLNLHHKTYKRIGMEHLRDLTMLCRDCHQALHLNLKSIYGKKRGGLWSGVRLLRKKLKIHRIRKNDSPNKYISKKVKKYLTSCGVFKKINPSSPKPVYKYKVRGYKTPTRICSNINKFSKSDIDDYKARMAST